ncbi:MAG: tetratricopeptide repeat protein [Polyangiales bacterium]
MTERERRSWHEAGHAHRDVFDRVFRTLALSKRHPSIHLRRDETLVLADRILRSCEDTLEFARLAPQVGEALATLSTDRGSTDMLLRGFEWWTKVLLLRLKPDAFRTAQEEDDSPQRRGQPKRHNLFGALQRLEALTAEELNLAIEQAHLLTDPAARAIFLTKESRNDNDHEAESVPVELLSSCLVAYLSLVDSNRQALRESLRGLIARPISDNSLLKRVRDEWHQHAKKFRGRESKVIELADFSRESDRSGRYLLLAAPEGSGKSALVAAVTRRLADACDYIGIDATASSRVAPWLAGALLHHGKAEKSPEAISRSLLAQANSLLLNPIEPPRFPNEEETISTARIKAPVTRPHEERESGDASTENWTPADRAASSARRASELIHTMLQRLVEERGEAFLVLDALDEVCDTETDLDFLPPVLPAGATVLLTSRPENRLIERLKRVVQPLNIPLKNLDPEDIAAITGIDDKSWNWKVRKDTQGIPLLISFVADEVRRLGNYAEVDVPRTVAVVHGQQLQTWNLNGANRRDAERADVLRLLAIMEPARAVRIEHAQRYLERTGQLTSRSHVLDLLEPVSSQIEGIGAGEIKLAFKSFAQYVRREVAGVVDLPRWIRDVATWLASDTFVDGSLRASFAETWSHGSQLDEANWRGVEPIGSSGADKLLQLLASQNNAEALFDVYKSREKRSGRLSDPARRALVAAAECRLPAAMHSLGARHLEARGVELDRELGKKWLTSAANAGDAGAMVELGHRMLWGDGVEADPAEGERWLREAKDVRAKHSILHLALWLLASEDEMRRSEGESILRTSAEAGDTQSMSLLGDALLTGLGMTKDSDEGQEWLQRAADEFDPIATLSLSNRQFDGVGVARDSAKAEERLRQADARGMSAAAGLLGWRLLRGDGVPRNVERGLTLMRKAADAGDRQAMLLLGKALMTGLHAPKSPSEGCAYLERAVDDGESQAALYLGELLFAGRGVKRNRERGLTLLRSAAESGNITAMRTLADSLLRTASSTGDEHAQIWLRKAAAKRWDAKQDLVERLIEGRGLARDLSQAHSLLIEWAESGSHAGMTMLGELILDEILPARQANEGLMWLRKGAESRVASRLVLADRLCTGRGVERHREEGLTTLMRLADEGNCEAMMMLARELERDVSSIGSANTWLQRAVDAGDIHARLTSAERLLASDEAAGVVALQQLWDSDGFEAALRVLVLHWIDAETDSGRRDALRALQRAAEQEVGWARLQLIELWLDGPASQEEVKLARKQLNELVANGDIDATLLLGRRLATGRGFARDRDRALVYLRLAARHGSPHAQLELAEELGRDASSVEEAVALVERVLSSGPFEHANGAGRTLYLLGRVRRSAEVLVRFARSSPDCARNLSFIVRRKEHGTLAVPSLDELCPKDAHSTEPVAKMNDALRFAGGVECAVDWDKADTIVASLPRGKGSAGVRDWWSGLAQNNDDAEGHLVLGWLSRHGILADPDGISVAQRFSRARAGGWAVPMWMNESTSRRDLLV